MSVNLKIDNFGSTNIKEVTQLDADVAAAATSLTVRNSGQFVNTDYINVGSIGVDVADLVTANGAPPDATHITVTALRLKHNRFDPVTSLFGNQIRIYRAPNVDGTQPLDAAFTLLTTLTIDFDQQSSSYTDASGGSGYWYKFTYYNQTSTAETDIADSAAARGGSINHYVSVDDIRHSAGFDNNQNITDATIDLKRQMAEDEINTALSGHYTVPFVTPVPKLITNIAMTLASGFLMLDDYGVFSAGTNKDGTARVTDARAQLKRIQLKELLLVDITGKDISIGGVGSTVSSWPNDTTVGLTNEIDSSGNQTHGGGNMFTIEHRY